jgi:biopolymer transport protein TolR
MANARRLLRRALRRTENEAGTGELNIVPFLDIVTNLMLFLLATTASIATVSEVRAELPPIGPGHGEPTLALSVTLTDHGAVMATAHGRVGPSCSIGEPGFTAARTRYGYDFAALARCATAMHAAHPDETQVVLSADPDVPYSDLVGAMDALRSSDETLLFPDLQISAGVR